MFCPARTNVTDNVFGDWRGFGSYSQNNCWNGKYCRLVGFYFGASQRFRNAAPCDNTREIIDRSIVIREE